MADYAGSRVQHVVSNTHLDLPQGLKRVTCMICLTPFEGLIYDKNSEVGSIAENEIKKFPLGNF